MPLNINRSKYVKSKREMHHAKRKHKKVHSAVLVSDKSDFRTKDVTRDTEGHFIK